MLEPFRVLHGHGIGDHRERLVSREQPVAAGERVTLEPAVAVVLAEHLHHAAVVRDVVVDVDEARDEAAIRHFEDRAEAVRVRLVGQKRRKLCGFRL